MLVNATHSAENLAHQLSEHVKGQESTKADDVSFVRETLLQEGLGVYDATDEEVNRLIDQSDPWPASYLFADIISRRAQIGWTTHGHSAVDVNIYASSPDRVKALIGNHENTEVGKFLSDYLDVDLKKITQELKDHASAQHQHQGQHWLGDPLLDEEAEVHPDHYQGDFKRSLDYGHLH